jgi:hypothetical protein
VEGTGEGLLIRVNIRGMRDRSLGTYLNELSRLRVMGCWVWEFKIGIGEPCFDMESRASIYAWQVGDNCFQSHPTRLMAVSDTISIQR